MLIDAPGSGQGFGVIALPVVLGGGGRIWDGFLGFVGSLID